MEPIDLTNRTRLLDWLFLLGGHVGEIAKVAEDARRPAGKQKLSRSEARKRLALGERNFKGFMKGRAYGDPQGHALMIHDPEADPPITDSCRYE